MQKKREKYLDLKLQGNVQDESIEQYYAMIMQSRWLR